MLNGDTVTRRHVTDAVAEDANVKSLGDPVGRDAPGEGGFDTACAGSGLAAIGIDIASKVGLVLGVTDQDDTLDRVKSGTSKLGEGVAGGGGTLRISLKDEAGVGVASKGVLYLSYNGGGTLLRVLAKVGRVDSVVLGAARD